MYAIRSYYDWKRHFLKQFKISAAYEYGDIIIDTLQIRSNMANVFASANINLAKSAFGRVRAFDMVKRAKDDIQDDLFQS